MLTRSLSLSTLAFLVVAGGALAQGTPAAKEAAAPAAAKKAAEGAPFDFDKTHSEVGFHVRHLGISKVKGKFTNFDGTIHADQETGKLTYVKGVVKTGSVDTGNEKRDNHLKQDDFFNSESFPDMILETRKITWNGDRFVAQSMLTIRDQTHPVVVKGELVGAQKGNFWGTKQIRAGYSAEFKINRQQFGLKFNRLAEGVSVVGNEVTVMLEVEAARKL
jgi:polyisoprenoid-binding protein YceI